MNNSSTFWQSSTCWFFLSIGTFWSIVAIPLLGWIPFVLPLTSLPIAIILAIRRYGSKATLFYCIFAMSISSFFENLSVMTGFPFGNYHYTLEPKLFFVPLFIAPIYASFGFICWSIACILLGEADRRLIRSTNLVILPVVAGAIMTMWDLVTDAKASVVGHAWIWEEGGRYFGVPETNFLGWWFVTYFYFQCFALYLRFSKTSIVKPRGSFDTYPPVLLYGAMGINVVVDFAVSPNGTVTDVTGKIWSLTGIVGPMAIVTLFTMIFVTILALHRLSDRT